MYETWTRAGWPPPTVLGVDDAGRVAQLRQMKRRATALLMAVTSAFVVIATLRSHAGWVPYALAAAEGSMVGGLADWFAVTALFRHPLGLPIPHTAIIRERKDQFGETLGAFVQENFLSAEVVAERIRLANMPSRAATWLTVPTNAQKVSGWVLDGLVVAAGLIGDDDVHGLLHDEIEQAIHSVPFAPLAGRALRSALDEHGQEPVVDAVLRGAMTLLEEQREPLRSQFGDASPWWLPGAVEDRIFDRIIDGALLLMASIASDPNHDIRGQIDVRLAALADRLEQDPEMAERVHGLVADALARGEMREWSRGLWSDMKDALREQAGDSSSRLHTRVSETVMTIGHRLTADETMQARLAGAVESAVAYVAEHHRDEISSLISATIARWDPEETSDKLELLLGRDLQFIRINGTVVGGLAGLAIHALAIALH